MIRILKSNKFVILLLISICIFFIIKPSVCSSSCLNGVSVWGLKVFPMLFPFFIFTRLIVNLSDFKPNFMDKFFNKAYHAPVGSFFVFCLSILCGYPMGAKLISNMHENEKISSVEAKKMLSFCSVSGPMFMIGTVGVAVFNSYKVGLVILISNLIACLINGFIYRGKQVEFKPKTSYESKQKGNILADCVYDSLISILMVGAYIILSFIIIDVLKELNIFSFLSSGICKIFKCETGVVESVLAGIFEITRGIIDLSSTSINLTLKAIISSGIIAFGGISIMMQSSSFLKNLNISAKTMILQKFTQCLICVVVSIPLSFLIL